MRAKLIAVVIAGLVLAAPAGAQTAGVTLYGRLNLDMEVVNGKQGGAGAPSNCPNPNQYRVSSNSSMFGLRGTEPLDGGLNAIFQVESKVFADTGRRRARRPRDIPRPARSVRNGADRSLPFAVRRDPADLRQRADADHVDPVDGSAVGAGVSRPAARRWLRRPALEFGPLRHADARRASTRASSTARAEGSPTPSSGIVSFGGFYDNGPLQLGLAYEVHHNIRGTRDAPLSDTALSIAGGYQFEGIRLGAVYERLRYDATPSTDITRDFYGLGVTIDAGPGLVFLYVGHAGNGKGSAADGSNVGGLVKGESTGSTQWEASYTYVLSARTWLYARVRQDQQPVQRVVHLRQQPVPGLLQHVSRTGGAASPAASSRVRSTSSEASTMLDDIVVSFDRALRTLAGHPTASRPTPGANLDDAELDRRRATPRGGPDARQPHRRGLRPGALRGAGARRARSRASSEEFAHAAREEEEHLAWTHQRLEELQDRTSLLNPLWYAGSFAIGLAAGVGGDRGNLGFVLETERQVEEHLTGHMERLPAADAKSRAIVEQMRDDEARHGAAARAAGAVALPLPVKGLMRVAADVMRFVAYRV